MKGSEGAWQVLPDDTFSETAIEIEYDMIDEEEKSVG